MGEVLEISFLPAPGDADSAVSAPCVLDLDGFGSVVGIELIELQSLDRAKLVEGIERAAMANGTAVRFSFDADAGAIYLRIPGDRARDQANATCIIRRTSVGRMVSLTLDLHQ